MESVIVVLLSRSIEKSKLFVDKIETLIMTTFRSAIKAMKSKIFSISPLPTTTIDMRLERQNINKRNTEILRETYMSRDQNIERKLKKTNPNNNHCLLGIGIDFIDLDRRIITAASKVHKANAQIFDPEDKLYMPLDKQIKDMPKGIYISNTRRTSFLLAMLNRSDISKRLLVSK